jgi:hypothetical protein
MYVGKMFEIQQCGAVMIGDRLEGVNGKSVKHCAIGKWISQLHLNMSHLRGLALIKVRN